MATLNFDASKVEPQAPMSQLPVSGPEGLPVIIKESELKENRDKTGGYLELLLEVIDGEHKGASGPYRLNLFHTNQQTVNIAYAQLSAICHVVNEFQVADSSQLHNKPFNVIVGLQKAEDAAAKGYTEVKAIRNSDGSAPGKAKPASAPVAPPTPPVNPVAAQPVAPAWGGNSSGTIPSGNEAAPAWGAPATTPETPAATTAAPPWATK